MVDSLTRFDPVAANFALQPQQFFGSHLWLRSTADANDRHPYGGRQHAGLGGPLLVKVPGKAVETPSSIAPRAQRR